MSQKLICKDLNMTSSIVWSPATDEQVDVALEEARAFIKAVGMYSDSSSAPIAVAEFILFKQNLTLPRYNPTSDKKS